MAYCMPRLSLRSAFLLIFFGLLVYLYSCIVLDGEASGDFTQTSKGNVVSHDNLLLTETECARAFPGLSREVDDAVALGHFELPWRDAVLLQGKIKDDQLYVIQAPRKGDLSPTMRHRQLATIQQIHRALVTSPEPLPDTSFAICTQDVPAAGTMSYARPVINSRERRIWPMPHFSFWSWPLPFVDSMPSASRAIAAIEDQTPFHKKKPKAVWRGTAWFNNGAGSNPRLRQHLVAATKDQPWADVQALDWNSNSRDASNALRIEDFCRHKYIVQTEGIGYSGRLQFHQLCESVVLTPALEWMQHTTHLVRPVFSSTILGTGGSSSHPLQRTREMWPVEYPLEQANIIFVAGDWSDLGAVVQWLEDNPDAAAGIAKRQRETYHEGGCLSPAAEVCYWRAMMRGWSKVAIPVGEGWNQKGVRFEEFVTDKELRQEAIR